MNQPPDQAPRQSGDGSPKFGRLLIALVLVVMLIGVITLSAEAFYS
jgi:4-hydroxybenzoate polyprenyltransferase